MFGFLKRSASQNASVQSREPSPFVRSCTLYCRPDSDQVIVAAVFNLGGPTAEQPGQAVLTTFEDATALSESIRLSLAACEYMPEYNLAHLKLSDWPAYKASGYLAIKRFEADFIRLHVRGVNDGNLFYTVTTPEFGEFGLQLMVLVHAHKGFYGEAVQYLIKQYLACKATVDTAA